MSLELRSHPRRLVEIPVVCGSGVEKGSAMMVNVSLSGALLENASIRPRRGALTEISFRRMDRDEPVRLIGTVVRHTGSGFAIAFATVSQALLELVG